MGVSTAAVLADVLGRLKYLRRLTGCALTHFEATGNPAHRTRANLVAAKVAAELGRENSPTFRRDLAQALRAIGWRDLKPDNIRQWKGVRARDEARA